MAEFPPEAYASDGTLWWELTQWPGRSQDFGVERKLAAWLRFNKSVGETFTTREARAALGEQYRPNDDEHFQRRLRQLRKDGWDIPSSKYDASLTREQYRVDKFGWYPGCGHERKTRPSVSKRKTRAIFDRDGWRCVVCGAGSGEPRPSNSDKAVRLTIGHVLSDNYGGSADIRNLRTECSDCNEPIRSEGKKPETPEELETAIRALKKADRLRLAQWIESRRYIRGAAEEVYDRYRQLPPGDQEKIRLSVKQLAGLDNC
ncbi:HNH endonuclease [Mycolicibacterium porcinum]